MPNYGFGGNGGRATTVVSGSPFTSLAALETWSSTHAAELINTQNEVAVAVVSGATIPSDNGTYQWSGVNQAYEPNAWVDYTGLDAADIKRLYESNPNTNAFTNPDNSTVLSVQGLAVNSVPVISAGGVVAASGLTIDTATNYVISNKALQVPAAGAVSLGNFDFSNAGASVVATELASGRSFYPVAYELETAGASKAWRENFGPVTTTPPAVSAVETFVSGGANNSIDFAIVNVGRGSAQQYTWTIPPGAAACSGVNLTIRIGSATHNPPVFDFKQSTGGTGFNFPANSTGSPLDVPMPLPRDAFFADGITIFVSLSAPIGQTLRLMGQTVTLPVVGTQTIPRVAVLGRTSTIAYIADTAETIGSVVAGANITVDNTNPRAPVISSTGGGGGGRFYFFTDASGALSSTAVKTALGTANSVTDWNAATLNTLTTDYTSATGSRFVYMAIPTAESVTAAGVSLNGGTTWNNLTPTFKFNVDLNGVNYAVYASSAAFNFATATYRFRFTVAQLAGLGITYTGTTPANQELIIGTGANNTAQRSGISLIGGRIPNTSIGVNSVQLTGAIQLDNESGWNTYKFRRIQFTGSGNYVRGIQTLPYLMGAASRPWLQVGDWVEVMNIGGTGNYNCQIQTHDVGEVLSGSLTGNGPTIPVSQTAVYRITYTGSNNTWLVSLGASGTAGGDPVPQTYWQIQDDGTGIQTSNDVEIRAGMQLQTQPYSNVGSATSFNLNTCTFTFTEHVGAAQFFKYLSNDTAFPFVIINQAVPSMDASAALTYLDGTVLNTSYALGKTVQPDGVGQITQITYISAGIMQCRLVMADVTNIAIGAQLRIGGAQNSLNNGDFVIQGFTDFGTYTIVQYANADASVDLDAGDTFTTVAFASPVLFWRVTFQSQSTTWVARCQFGLNSSFSILAELDNNWFTPGAGHVSWLDEVYQEVVSGQGGNLHTDQSIHAQGTIRAAGGMILAGRNLSDSVGPSQQGDTIVYNIATGTWVPGAPQVCQLPVPQTLLTSANQWQVLTFDGSAMSMQFPRFAGVPTSRLDALQNADAVRYDSTAQTWYNSRTAGYCFARRHSTTQAIANLTDVRVAFDTGDSFLGFNSGETGITYDGTTNVGRFTNSSGRRVLVSVTYQVPWAANAAGIRFTWIRINGIAGNRVAYFGNQANAFGDVTVNTGSAVFALDNNQFFEVWCYQSSGSTLNIGPTAGGMDAGYGTRIQIARLNP